MTKRLSAIIAAATLGLSAAAFAQTSTPSTQTPSAAPPAGHTTTKSGTTTGKTMSEADVRKELESQGYTRISDLKKKGNHYEAKGMKDGKAVSLNVDAHSGKVVAR